MWFQSAVHVSKICHILGTVTTSLSMSRCRFRVQINSCCSFAPRDQRSCPVLVVTVKFHPVASEPVTEHAAGTLAACCGALPGCRDHTEHPGNIPARGLGSNLLRSLAMKPEKKNSSSKEQHRACALNLGSSEACFQALQFFLSPLAADKAYSDLASWRYNLVERPPPQTEQTYMYDLLLYFPFGQGQVR